MIDLSTVERLLTEILAELRLLNAKFSAPAVPPPPPPPTHPNVGGYYCICGTWVMQGTSHVCSGRKPYYPASGGTITCCGKAGPNGGRCYLNREHSGACIYATVMNVTFTT